MILRRLSQSLKEQNWTAIFIEFILLISGVFLGIQVANWNEQRRDEYSEQQYLERLRDELADIVPKASSSQVLLSERSERLEEARAFFATGKGGEALDKRHCAAIGTSHIYAATIFYPPTIKELISTGRILLIRDPAIRTAIMAFDQAHADMTQLRTDIQIDRLVLARHYPALIKSGVTMEWETSRCDFPEMRNNQAFLNDFTDNMRRFGAYSGQLGEHQSQALESLANALGDQLLTRAPTTAARDSKQ